MDISTDPAPQPGDASALLARLRETESRFRNMADASPVLLWMAREDGLCTFFNQSWIAFTGRSQEEEWGVGWAEGVHPEDFQHCIDTYVQAFNERRTFEMEYRLRRRDGDYRWILDRGTPRYTLEGAFAGYIGSCVDITERRRLESELRRAVSIRDDFVSVASHELKTPMTPLKLQIQSLLHEARTAPTRLAARDLVAGLELAERQVARLESLANRLLDISSLRTGAMVLAEEDLDLAKLVRDVAGRFDDESRRAAAPLSVRAPSSLRGRWDGTRLEQVLTNLLSNALKYGAGQPVEVALVKTREAVLLSVADRGIGISPTDQRRVFERFERAAPGRFGGLGLGLWIADQIVRSMGGTLSIASQPDQGAIFTVRLPRSPQRATAEPRPAADGAPE